MRYNQKYEVGYLQRRGGFVKRLWYAPGGLITTVLSLRLTPPGRTQRGVNENFSPAMNYVVRFFTTVFPGPQNTLTLQSKFGKLFTLL